MKDKKSSDMEKAENSDVQTLQNAAGDCVPSPNTRRRLKLKAPKLHIKIPFLKRTHRDDSPSPECHTSVSHSLPSESHMPSNIKDIKLYHDCEEIAENSHEDCSTQCSVEDEADSEKHQSDLDESEKENDEEVESQKCANNLDENAVDKPLENTATEDDASATTPTSADKCFPKSCLKNHGYHGRRRASTYPGPIDCLEASFKRCVTFSPDTAEPRSRDCKYREWIEKKCHHPKSPPINIKHEKTKCQLNQMKKVNLSDYMSRGYGSSFFSPMGSFGGDVLGL